MQGRASWLLPSYWLAVTSNSVSAKPAMMQAFKKARKLASYQGTNRLLEKTWDVIGEGVG